MPQDLRTQMRLRPAPLAGSWLRGLKPGHKLVWHTTGIEAGEALLQAIDAAQVTIDAQLYILEADTVSQRVVAALVRARQRGVRVRLLLDGLGCSDCDSEHLGQLVAAGAAVRVYKPLRWSVPWKHWIRRNHRKLFLFDHDSAIVGGRNVGGPLPCPWRTGYDVARPERPSARTGGDHAGAPAEPRLAHCRA